MMPKFYLPPLRHPSAVGRGTLNRAVAAATPGPADCVRIHRSGGEWVTLVGYDDAGEVQIEVRIRRERVSPQWERWILRWIRSWSRAALTLMR